MPFSDTRLLNVLSHTFWFLPNVASCYAMYNLLQQKQNSFYHDYHINVCAGTKAGIGVDALEPVQKSMGDPLTTKTITLSCGKLTTGVTVKPWTGIFMLRNLKSPETYFQAAFRVQSPWTVRTGSGTDQIMKYECYVFDFALDRALKQISDYSCRLNVSESNPEKKVAEFINFLPVLAYDGSSMKQIDAQDILDIAMAGTSATLLAKRWESALLVNVDNDTLRRLMANKEAMEALMKIEGFRSLNSDIETIINKSESVKKAKKEKGKELTKEEKKEISEEEKEYKSMRKQIQEKLIKFATRVPIFMYLTDYRERSLKDVITQLEPGLFKKVTGLDVKDFNLLVELNVFNASLMNDAIFKFKRYEDSSLSYTGLDKHENEDVGGWDTVVKRKEYELLFYNQQSTMNAPEIDEADVPEADEEPEPPKAPVPTRTPPAKPDFVTAAFGVKSPIAPAKPQQPEKPKVDVSGVAVGSAVAHAKSKLLNTKSGVLTDKRLDGMSEWDVSDVTSMQTWLDWLEQYNVFFSAPLDIDFMMLEQMASEYKKSLDTTEGPRLEIAEDGKKKRVLIQTIEETSTYPAEYGARIKKDIKSTLKEEGGDGSTYSTEQQNLMIWYTYFFLNRGKPSTHIAVLSRLSDEAIKGNIPPVLERLIETAERILKGDKK